MSQPAVQPHSFIAVPEQLAPSALKGAQVPVVPVPVSHQPSMQKADSEPGSAPQAPPTTGKAVQRPAALQYVPFVHLFAPTVQGSPATGTWVQTLDEHSEPSRHWLPLVQDVPSASRSAQSEPVPQNCASGQTALAQLPPAAATG